MFWKFAISSTTILLYLLTGIAYSGTIKGAIVYTGTPPVVAPIKTGKYKEACGSEFQNESVVISKNGLENVVVSIAGLKANKASENGETPVFDQHKCRYTPHVLSIAKDSDLKIRSSDPINHNIHTYSFDNDPINLMFTPGQEHTYRVEMPEVIKVECDLHSWMTGWIVVTDSAYSAISRQGGTYEIKNVPPGTYTFNAWHEVFGSLNQTVKVGDGVVEVNFDFSKATPQVPKT